MLISARGTFRPAWRGCVFSLSLLVAASAAVAQPGSDPPDGDATLRDGVVVDSLRSVLYLMSPEGGVDAVDVVTGQVLWRTPAAAKPLYLQGVLLVAQGESGEGEESAGELEIVVLHTELEGEVLRRIAVPLPEDVRPAIDDTLGRSFRIRAERRLPVGVIVSWLYVERTVRGVPPGADEDPELRREGAFTVAAGSGQFTVLDAEEVAALPGPPDLEVPSDERLDNVPGRQFFSSDRGNVLASERLADPRAYRRYRWTIYHRGSGDLVGELRHPASVAPLMVAGSIFLYETRPVLRRVDGEWLAEPLMVRAADALSGLEIWALEVRDTEYRGPVPP